MPNRHDVVIEARKWINVPWKHQGRSIKGIDCIGLVAIVAKTLGISERDSTNYVRHPDGFSLVKAFDEEMDSISLNDIQEGDVVIFSDNVYPCHVGIISNLHNSLYLIHAHAMRRKVLEEAYAYEWPKKARKAFSFRGVT